MTGMIVVAESRGLLRAGLVGLLSEWQGGLVLGAATLDAAIAMVPPGSDGGSECVLLMDLDLLGQAGPSALHQVRGRIPAVRIIALAGRESHDDLLACLAAGAHGYVPGTAEFPELARAIDVVRSGGVHVPASLARPVVVPSAAIVSPALTNRQQDVLRLLAEGRSTKDIARSLDLAVSTIKVHLAALYRTVGARNRVEALCRAGVLPAMSRAA